MPSVLTAVIFDLDGVLSQYDYALRLKVLSLATGLPEAQIEAVIWSSGFEDEADRGRYSSDEYLTEISKRLGLPVSKACWLEARRAAMHPDQEMLDLAREVGAKVPIALLTNNGPFLRESLADLVPQIPEIFDPHTYFSGDLGVSKPEPAAFHEVLALLGAVPETTLFIDDNEGYIAGAKRAGLQVHHFTARSRLEADLRRHGLL